MTDDQKEKRSTEQDKSLDKLEQENKRLLEEKAELQKQIIEILKESILSAENMNAKADETIQNAAIAADLAYQAEQAAVKVAELATGTSQIVTKVTTNAKNVEEVASKVATSADGASKSTWAAIARAERWSCWSVRVPPDSALFSRWGQLRGPLNMEATSFIAIPRTKMKCFSARPY